MVPGRDKNGRFAPGVSGNPGGRPKAEVNLCDIIDATVTPADWKRVIATLKNAAMAGSVRAASELMDRRFGKPIQENRLSGPGGAPIEVIHSEQSIRSLHALADAIGTILPSQDGAGEGALDATEQAPVAGNTQPG